MNKLIRLSQTFCLLACISECYALSSSDWTGLSVGVIAGGASANIKNRTYVLADGNYFTTGVDAPQISAVGTQSIKKNNLSIGGQASYSFAKNNWGFGFITDFRTMKVRNTATSVGIYQLAAPSRFTINSATTSNWLFTARPKIGHIWGQMLLYSTGGLAIGNVKNNYSFSDDFGGGATERSSTTNKAGYVIGAGFLYMLTQNLGLSGEYLHVDLGNTTSQAFLSFTNPFFNGAILGHKSNFRNDTITLGVNYKIL